LDFIIVISGVAEFFLKNWLPTFGGVNFRGLRTLRVLRPLKGLKTIPSLRKQVSALFRSLEGLSNVLIFLSFIFIIFGIIGLQLFSGSLYYSCRVGKAPIPGEKTWQKFSDPSFVPAFSNLCTPENKIKYPWVVDYATCPKEKNSYCGSPLDVGLDIYDDGVRANADILFGISTFDNIGQSLIGVF